MAEKYRRVEKTQEKLPNNEIRVRRGVRIGRYLNRAVDVLSGKEGNEKEIVIKGVSNAMESVAKLAELVKHRVKGLYQVTSIQPLDIVDEYEPLEEGLDHLEFKRTVTMLVIRLSKNALDPKDVGFQEPIPESQVEEYTQRTMGGPGGRPPRYEDDERRKSRSGGPQEGGRRLRGGFRGGFRGERGNFRGDRGDRGDRGGRGGRYMDGEDRRGGRGGRYNDGEERKGGRGGRGGRYNDEGRYDGERRPPRNYEDGERRGGRGGRGGYDNYGKPPRTFGDDERRPRGRGGFRGDRDNQRGGRGEYGGTRGGDYPRGRGFRGRGDFENREQRDRDYDRPPRGGRGRGGQ